MKKIKVESRVAEYKPLLYTTTIRNPERYKDFMHILKQYDGKVLTDKIVEKVERELFKYGIYRPKKLPKSVERKWVNLKQGELASTPLIDKETKEVYDLNDPLKNANVKGHKEAGFNRGWQSRFQTQYKFMMTLGFVYYKMNEKIVFSDTGNKLAESVSIKIDDDVVSREIIHPEYEQMAFMQAFAKQQRCNPFIRELNDNIPLILLLQVIKLLNNDKKYNNCGISYKEIPLIIFWKDNNAQALYKRIKKLRKEYGYEPSNEVIQDICVNEILGGFKQFKLKSIVSEYPDEFVRKMRMTGLITLRGAGRFVDVNHNEDKKIDYILKKYSVYSKYQSEWDYFKYMSSIDKNLFDIKSIQVTKTKVAEQVEKWANYYSWDTIKKELKSLMNHTASKDDVLKFLSEPVRLEFLTAIAIKSRMPKVIVMPNYSCDDEGLPTSTAGGNKGDIECFEESNGILVEVSMAGGRVQTVMEGGPVERHLESFSLAGNFENTQGMFIAPSIYPDTVVYFEFVLYKSKGKTIIKSYNINEFIKYIDSSEKLYCQVRVIND